MISKRSPEIDVCRYCSSAAETLELDLLDLATAVGTAAIAATARQAQTGVSNLFMDDSFQKGHATALPQARARRGRSTYGIPLPAAPAVNRSRARVHSAAPVVGSKHDHDHCLKIGRA